MPPLIHTPSTSAHLNPATERSEFFTFFSATARSNVMADKNSIMKQNSEEEQIEMKEIDQQFTVWKNLGAVDTIYEEDYEFSSSSSPSPPLSPPPPLNLHSRVEEWSKVTGVKTDVCIRVSGKCFHLHKDPLASKSRYLKRELAAALDVTVNPPLKITAETFSVVADFCYGAQIVITPFNVAALRTAGELLEMSETENGESDGENLAGVTEKYFRRVVAVNRDYASAVFRSCLELLPEAETMAFLGSRCLEAWSLEGGDGDITCFQDFKSVEVENFLVLASSLNRRFKCHDLVYKIALLYLKGYGGKMTEEQKVLICNFIDCDKLSPKLLLHAVQNPLMPLRFIVRAMLIEQLNTRHSILISTTATPKPKPPPITNTIPKNPLTLGAILKRDAAARESAKLKAAMRATNSRIRTLEDELTTMKLKLHHSDNKNQMRRRLSAEEHGGGRSASFHFGGENRAVVARGERGSTSSSVFRMSADFKMDKLFVGCKPGSDGTGSSSGRRSIGRRLIEGIRNAFRVSRSGEIQSRKDQDEEEEEEEDDDDDEIVVMRRNQLYVN